MGDGFQFFDIIILALIAGFLVLRLRSTLGRRTGHQESPDAARWQRQWDNGDSREAPAQQLDLPGAAAAEPDDEELPTGPVGLGVGRIRAVDPGFRLTPFMEGAKAAFEMILAAFAKGDLETLRGLLSDEVYGDFKAAIERRQAAGQTMSTEMLGFKRLEAEEAELVDGHMAQITVRFVSEQVNVVKDADGQVVEGDPEHIAQVTDLWTFARDTRSDSPNWLLVATDTVD
ncbi:Tim44/TimA family putative adaptor protein [Roseospirillum parvum]|uniref:Predicted lipid-binding transport protein, Tim44 family n=1 Tax=Roseospirillum parvum TaxID=83401 RepID=A0A1G8DL62_9PROT|nr:Tim44/TimA family putative adaptor protein [Roseospirillum parvum]SDH58325.1 Predicted lipid-binding transport protein, Tim44 family [Roseospirillum parvum]